MLPQDNATARYIHHAEVPSRCPQCARPYTRTMNETGNIWFCANRYCLCRAWGYHRDFLTGFISDGIFTDAESHMERYRHHIGALSNADAA
jgi:hypothetical protein